MAKIPKILKNFNLFLGTDAGQESFAGIVDEVTLPTLAITTEDHRAGGMDSSVPLDLGMEPMELGFTMAEFIPNLFKQFGLVDQNSVAARFRGGLVDNDSTTPMVIECRGMYSEFAGAGVSAGEKIPMEVTMMLTYYKLTIGGEDLIEVDILNMTRIIDGVDQLADLRGAIDGA